MNNVFLIMIMKYLFQDSSCESMEFKSTAMAAEAGHVDAKGL